MFCAFILIKIKVYLDFDEKVYAENGRFDKGGVSIGSILHFTQFSDLGQIIILYRRKKNLAFRWRCGND